MICNSYNQLTIVEKTQFVGKLIHLIQSEESAFLAADSLLKIANDQGLLEKVTILPKEDLNADASKSYPETETEVHQLYEVISSSDFLHQHSNNLVGLLYRTRNTLQRSYQKVFAKLAS